MKQHQVHILNDTNEPNISATVTPWWFFADDPAAPNARYRVESRTFLGLEENFRDVECHTGRP